MGKVEKVEKIETVDSQDGINHQSDIRGLEESILKRRGLRPWDKLVIWPMQGRKRTISLNRTMYNLQSTKDYNCSVEGTQICLPALAGNEYSFTLTLCKNKSGLRLQRDCDEGARYVLKSNNSLPFRINNTMSRDAYVERGDRVDIGHNRLDFFGAERVKGRDSSNKIDSSQDELLLDRRIIDSDLSVLIEGETGTGKTRLAKIIHEKSKRLGPFVHINLSSFSENLIESELFGHVKGAFTGAINNKRGAFFNANYGTLFLDEIDSLPASIQTKLLLFLDSKQIRPVGGDEVRGVDVRLVFAAGERLLSLARAGGIRWDFYYRITSGAVVSLRPLRERAIMIKRLCSNLSVEKDISISNNLVKYYQGLPWPGNIRQFLGHLNKKIVIAKGRKLEFDQSDELLSIEEDPGLVGNEDLFCSMDEMKQRYAQRAYVHFGKSVVTTAKVLNMSRNTLRNLIVKRLEDEKKITPQ